MLRLFSVINKLCLFVSKHQLVKPITCSMKLKAIEQLLLERDNFELLQMPYLSEVCENRSFNADCQNSEQMDTAVNDQLDHVMLSTFYH